MQTVQSIAVCCAFVCGAYAILKKSPEGAGLGVICLALALALEIWPAK